uniref:BLM_N domain-containing protein n=1 Tax=Panagrellus redivivus TaxID=6233 RepID=A0A7E4UZM7_PANRE
MESRSSSKPFRQVYLPTPEEISLTVPKSPKGTNIFGKKVSIEWHHSPSMLPASKRAALVREEPCNAASWTELGSFNESSEEEDDTEHSHVAQNWSRFHPLHSSDTQHPWRPSSAARDRLTAVTDLGETIKNSMKEQIMVMPPGNSNATQDFGNMNLVSPAPTTSSCSNDGSPLKRKNSIDVYGSPVRSNQTVSSADFETPTRPTSELDDFHTPVVKRARTDSTKSGSASPSMKTQAGYGISVVQTPKTSRKRGYLSALGTPMASSTPTIANRVPRKSVFKPPMEKIKELSPVKAAAASITTSNAEYEDSFDDPNFNIAFICSPTKADTGTSSNTSVPPLPINTSNKNGPSSSSSNITPPGSSVESNPPPVRPSEDNVDDSFWDDTPIIFNDEKASPTASLPEPSKPEPVPRPADDPYDSFDEDKVFDF